MTVLVVDYGMSNLGSVRRAFEECGARVLVSSSPEALAEAERVVLPGVGAFPEAMQRLNSAGWTEALQHAARAQTPILGICLGMQLLGESSEEIAPTPGLGLVPGRVRRLIPRAGERVPHVGWNSVQGTGVLFEGIPAGADFYFVHSFGFDPETPAASARTGFAQGVVAAVEQARVYGAQFHPEKSSKAGFQLIRNFLRHG